MFSNNIYNDKLSFFKMLLEKYSSLSIHDRNIQCLATEIDKVSSRLSPPLVSSTFRRKIVTFIIRDLILSFSNFLLGLNFTLVQ